MSKMPSIPEFRPALGWMKAPIDGRDYHVRNFIPRREILPDTFSWRKYMTLKKNQNLVGACTAFAWSFVNDFQKSQELNFSTYYNTAPRFLYSRRANAPGEGMDNRDAAQINLDLGIAPEVDCPGNWGANTNADVICDDPQTMQDAYLNRLKSYAACWTVDDMMQATYKFGPIVWGGPVFQSWVTPPVITTGVIPMPAQGEQPIGGHDICVTGWTLDYLEFQTPWWLINGVLPWGDECFGMLPKQYAANFLNDGEADSYSSVPLVVPTPVPPVPTDCFAQAEACLNSGSDPITCLIGWILCEFNISALSPAQYASLYKMVKGIRKGQ
jgi:hypothetical protein